MKIFYKNKNLKLLILIKKKIQNYFLENVKAILK